MTSKLEPSWKKQGFKSRYAYRKNLIQHRGFEPNVDYLKYLKQIKDKTISKEVLDKQLLCKSLQKLTSNVKDPESLFSDIEFVREISGCKIPTKKRNSKNI